MSRVDLASSSPSTLTITRGTHQTSLSIRTVADNIFLIGEPVSIVLTGSCLSEATSTQSILTYNINSSSFPSSSAPSITHIRSARRAIQSLYKKSHGQTLSSLVSDVGLVGHYLGSPLNSPKTSVPNASSSVESHFISLSAMGEASFIDLSSEWSQLTQKIGEATRYFYRNVDPPASTNLWTPSWLVLSRSGIPEIGPLDPGLPSSTSNMGVVDLPVTFNNGVGLIPTMNFGDQLFHVYRVYSGSLMGSSVLSRLSGGGTNFDIASYVDGDQLLWTPSGKTGSSTSASKGQITLTSNHTGVLKVAYSYTTGSTIPINEAITTYPMYRALRGSGETGEFSVAGDAYSFSNRAFRLLAEKFPENSRWAQSAAANLRSAKRAATTEMPNPKLLSVRVGSTDALSGASFYDGRSGSTLTRDATSGIVHLQVPGASGGAVAIYENISRYWSVSDSQNTVLKVSANADIAVPLSIGLQTSQAFDTNTYYEADFIADGGGDALLTKEFRRQDFYKWSNAQYIAPRNGSSVFSGGGGLAATSLESISANGGNFLMTTKFTFDETGGGYAGGVSNISTPFALGSLASIKIAYKVSGGPARIRVRDSNGYNWSFDLSSTTFTETTIQLSDWFKDGYLPAPGGVTAPAAGNVQEVQFVPIPGQSTTLWVWYVGQSAPIQLPAGSGIYATKVAAIDINPHTLSIGDVEILRPGNAYTEFGPGLLPFAESIYASSVSDTTYMSYTSYQDPNLWIDAEEWSLLDNMVSYHQASQMNYQDQSPGGSVLGPFTPVYYWPHMQALELGASPGTWSFNGFDSFGSWNGFQGRNAANLARAWWRLKDDAGHLPTSLPTIVINYLVWLDSFLTSNSDAFPAVFGPSSIPSTASSPDPHFAALTLKAAIYARLAGASEQVTSRLIRKSYSHLMSVLEYRESQADLGLLWTDSSEKKSAGYWYGEALEALVLMERYHSILSL